MMSFRKKRLLVFGSVPKVTGSLEDCANRARSHKIRQEQIVAENRSRRLTLRHSTSFPMTFRGAALVCIQMSAEMSPALERNIFRCLVHQIHTRII